VLLRAGAAHAPAGLSGTREPLQLGAEIFGHAGLEADLEAAELALDALSSAGLNDLVMDLADARVLRGVLAGVPLESEALQEVVQALSQKDGSALAELTRAVPEAARAGLRALPRLYGGAEVLEAARQALPQRALITEALDQLQWLASHLQQAFPALAHRLRPVRHERLCLLQRPALCHLRQG
jgi:ATP phosphoribosyltransferase regulatory subunit